MSNKEPTPFKVSIENSKACASALQWFKTRAEIKPDGSRAITIDSIHDMVRSQLPEEILLEFTSIHPEIPEFTKRRIVSFAITRWLKFKKYTNSLHIVPSFSKALEVELRSLKKKQQPYRVLMLLNLDPERFAGISSLTVRGGQISFLEWNELDNLEVEQLWEKARVHSVANGRRVPVFVNDEYEVNYLVFTPILVSLESYNTWDAVSMAVEKVDFFRAALNFVPGTSLTMKIGQPSPICKFLPSPIYGIFGSEGNLLADVYTTEHYRYNRQEKVSQNEFDMGVFHLSYT